MLRFKVDENLPKEAVGRIRLVAASLRGAVEPEALDRRPGPRSNLAAVGMKLWYEVDAAREDHRIGQPLDASDATSPGTEPRQASGEACARSSTRPVLVLFGPPDTASNLEPANPAAEKFPLQGHGSIDLSVLFNDPADKE